MEAHTVGGLSVVVWPNVIGSMECEAIERTLPWRVEQEAVQSQSLADSIGDRLASLTSPWPLAEKIAGFDAYVTLTDTRKAIDWHVDRVFEGGRETKYKLIAYLNEIDRGVSGMAGGLELRREGESIALAHGVGTIVLFDLRLEHRSAAFSSRCKKRLVGVRAIVG